MRMSEVVDSLENAEKFIKINAIKPKEIIVVWDEDISEEGGLDKQGEGK